VSDGALRLSIPPAQGLWCADLHEPALRVSAVQSGNWSGPVGSTRGQSPFRDDLVVREEQPTVLGFTPLYGRIEVTCRARIGPRSMFSAWMIGLEDEPDRRGEICLIEVFGDAIGEDAGTPVVQHGCGIKEIRDPALTQDFDTMPLRRRRRRPSVCGVLDTGRRGLPGRRRRGTALGRVAGVPAGADPWGVRLPGARADPDEVPATPELVVSRVVWEPMR